MVNYIAKVTSYLRKREYERMNIISNVYRYYDPIATCIYKCSSS